MDGGHCADRPASIAGGPHEPSGSLHLVEDSAFPDVVRAAPNAYATPSFSAALLVPSTRFLIFWNAMSRA
jgi:hypothetical protein